MVINMYTQYIIGRLNKLYLLSYYYFHLNKINLFNKEIFFSIELPFARSLKKI